jgi:hypothetical protein
MYPMTIQEMPVDTMRDWNGHFRTKAAGATNYDGELESLPLPAHSPSADEAFAAMYEDGYVIFPSVFNKDEVAQLRAKLDSMGEPDEKYVVPKWCFNKHLPLDFANDPFWLDVIDKPGVIELADAIHGPPYTGDGPGGAKRGAVVLGGTIWITGKGRKMGVHLDGQPVSVPESVHSDPAVRIPIFSSTAHFYLNDMRMDLGPTTVVPGSHKAGRHPTNENSFHGITPKAVMVNAGDAMFFRADIWHGAGLNSSDERRYMIQVFYGVDWMARGYPPMKYDHYWSKEVIEKATPTQRRLLGAGKAPSAAAY